MSEFNESLTKAFANLIEEDDEIFDYVIDSRSFVEL